MRKLVSAIALVLVMLLLGSVASAAVHDISDQCKFWVSEGSAYELHNNSMSDSWKPTGAKPEFRVKLPDSGAAWIQIGWSKPPQNYVLTEYDASQNEIGTHTQADDEFACLTQLLPLKPETRYLSVSFSQKGQGVNELSIYPEGELGKLAIQWEKPLDKCDLMVISTHQDDEWLWFGAMIPYYDLVKNKDVQVVYMANCGRLRYQEALNSLAVAGVRTYPHFVGLTDRRDDTLEQAVRTWTSKDHILEVVVGFIRRYKPEVILTHDWNGEYGHPQHILTSRSMEYAIEAAADPAQYPDSAREYGAWQVKKLYRHLEKKSRIQFDWHVAYPEFGGRTGLQVAIDSMAQNASQLRWYQVEDHGKYDNSLFGLSYSTVGDDVMHNDLFENIPENTPTPVPSDTPQVTPSPAPTVEATSTLEGSPAVEVTPTVEAAPVAEVTPTTPPSPSAPSERKGSAAPLFAAVLALFAALGGGAYLLYAREQKRRRRRRRRKPVASSAKRPPSGPAARRSPHPGTKPRTAGSAGPSKRNGARKI